MGSQLIATTRDITASALGPKKLGLHKHPSVQQVVNNVAVVFMSFREIDGFVKRSEEHTSELQSLMRTSYAVFCFKKKKRRKSTYTTKIEQERKHQEPILQT